MVKCLFSGLFQCSECGGLYTHFWFQADSCRPDGSLHVANHDGFCYRCETDMKVVKGTVSRVPNYPSVKTRSVAKHRCCILEDGYDCRSTLSGSYPSTSTEENHLSDEDDIFDDDDISEVASMPPFRLPLQASTDRIIVIGPPTPNEWDATCSGDDIR